MSDVVGGAPSGAPPAHMRGVRLSDHVRSVAIGDQTVLLDLRRDKYLCLSTTALAQTLRQAESGHHSSLYTALSRGGLVSHGEGSRREVSKQIRSTLAPMPATFVYACVWAQRIVAARRLDKAVGAFSHSSGNVDASAATARFLHWRPWFPARNVCLFDSLALSRFLLFAGARFELVFGVRLAPFAAHCWVESSGRILNDESGYCRSFTEIMRVDG